MHSAELIATDTRQALVGIGLTGQSVVRHMRRAGRSLTVFDSRVQPPGLAAFRRAFPDLEVRLGEPDPAELARFSDLILSPGIDPATPWLAAAQAGATRILGDIELFVQAAQAPIAAITGSNAKSTVTCLLGEMAAAAGRRVAVGGNLGPAALDLLDEAVELYVLELSSFQLELVGSLGAEVATVLNMSADHLDRYPSMIEYHAAKQRIYRRARHLVYNRDDPLTEPLAGTQQKRVSFGSGPPDLGDFGLREADGEVWLMRGNEKLLAESEVRLKGRHNLCNLLAGLALGSCCGLALEPMLAVARRFAGLPHRAQVLAERAGVLWVDDSKATNVGATGAALAGFGRGKNILLIAGGQTKGQSFAPLRAAVERHVKRLILMGEGAAQLEAELAGAAEAVRVEDLAAAVRVAARGAARGDCVLLSPACASLDMFASFAERGERFAREVEVLALGDRA